MAKRRTSEQVKQDKEKEQKEKALTRQFTDWIYEQYNICFLPSYAFMRFQQVYKGTYKNLSEPITTEDLWQMWKIQMPKLNEIYAYNQRKGNTMDGCNRVMYDLAIIVGKYDSYKHWKEKQAIMLSEHQQIAQESTVKITSKAIQKVQKVQTKPKTDELDISSILDEI